ncbi:MAG: aminotransferase class I/II-fold pyridoxal phosphate-dependent enzyme [Gemmatimonadetes bacterium]|nr:aminotransferase class I/II-fold pyridoxal phosphate-dependent enzyme [Gemmatimonadota bacterium]MDA1102917.1 aminotransferase class I/II-fold pyridoxal phosphate-dependent enzyme [Gemmatimonadota bacterium]
MTTAAPATPLFADRVHRIGTEAAFALGALIRDVEDRGDRVIRCNIGQPDFPVPDHIVQAVKRALDKGLTTYCDPQGIPELRAAIARSVGAHNGLDIDPNRVVVYPGGRPPIGFAHMAYSEAGEEVIYPSPGYPLFESFIPYFKCVPVPVVLREEEGFGLTRTQLEPLITEKTGLIFLNFPSNPTGGVATRAQLEGLSELILEKTDSDVRVYSDEAYEAITFDGDTHVSIASMPGMEARTIIASGVSKTYAWTGGRVGWAVYPTVAEALIHRKLAINYFASIPPYNQWGAIEALESPESAPAIRTMVEAFQRRRDQVVAGLNAIDGVSCQNPKGAFYVFPNVGDVLDRLGAIEAYEALPDEVRQETSPSTLFQLFLLHNYNVATMDRRSFCALGSEGQHFLRLSIANADDELAEAVRRIDDASRDVDGFGDFLRSGVRLTL